MTVVQQNTTSASPLDSSKQSEFHRRRVIGVDVLAEYPLGYKQLIDQARSGAMGTHLRLVAGIDETDVKDGSEGNEYFRLRFLARRDDVHVTDDAIFELLAQLTVRLRWSELIKLEEFDGVPAFVALPTL